MKNKVLPTEILFTKVKGKTLVNWNALFEVSFVEGRVSKPDAARIIRAATHLMAAEPNLLYLQDPLTIVGDVHGQFYDMKEIFRLGGNPETTKYLFLGDYVDRGIYAMEILLTLYSLKANFPNQIFLLRGNHECRQMTQFHNFRDEVLEKYDQEIYDMVMDSFDQMPLACIINGQYFALHGGISPGAMTCAELNKLPRAQEPPVSGPLCDILWADPIDNQTGAMTHFFIPNDSRGCSYYFGHASISQFLKNNNLLSLIRAHEAQFEGFKAYLWQKAAFPQVITLFSAPNYCGTYSNKGAIMRIHNREMRIYQYNFTPKPDLMLHLGDAFTWSIPLLSKALLDLFIGFLSGTSDVLTGEEATTNDLVRLSPALLAALGLSVKDVVGSQQNAPSKLEKIIDEEEHKSGNHLGDVRHKTLSAGEKVILISEENAGADLGAIDNSFFRIQKHEYERSEKRPN
jgi:serine/threonine-protein phosphatase 2B catalytic subunit